MKAIYTFFLVSFLVNLNFAQTQIGADLEGFLADDDFGYSVSISDNGNRVAVGAPGDIIGQEAGYVQIFEWNGSEWVQLGTTITGQLPFNNAGGRIALSGNGERLILGAIYNNNATRSGSVLVYEYDGSDWNKLGAELGIVDDLMSVGQAVAISENGDIIAFTTTEVTSTTEVTGRVDVFEWTGSNWVKRGSTFNPTETFDLYGYSIDLSDDGSRIAIGAANGFSPLTNSSAGFAQIFEFVNGQWQQLGNNISGIYELSSFGTDVSISGDGNRIIVYGPATVGNAILTGTVRAFDFDGNNWQLVGNELIGGSSFDRFGDGVRLSGNGEYFVYGAFNDGDNQGCSAVYKLSSNKWEMQGEKLCGDADRDQFGYSVDISSDGSSFITGARVNDNEGVKSGYARVWNTSISSSIENISAKKISLFPNPTQGILFLSLNEGDIDNIGIYDLNSRLVFKDEGPFNEGIDLSFLIEGQYILRTVSNSNIYHSKIVKCN